MIRIKNKFKELKQKKQKAFGVFLTAGYPSLEYSKDIFKKMMPHMKNEKQRDSWYRDQFYNPYEDSVTLKTLQEVADETKTKLNYSNLDTDDTYYNVMNKLNTYEFTSGFIYGGYSK